MATKCKVRCIETGVIYNSIAEAVKSIGLKTNVGIYDSIKNPNKTSGGYHWEYYEEPNLPGEIWKDAKCLTGGVLYDFTGIFECSSRGRIRQLSNGQILSGSISVSGYIDVNINNITHKVHRMIATTFIPNDDLLNKTQVNHISEDKTNNSIDNLEWVTPKENSNHGTRTQRSINTRISKYGANKLTEIAVTSIRRKVVCTTTNEVFNSLKEAADKFNIKNTGNIGNCCRGKRKSAGKLPDGTPLVWKFIEE